MEDEIKENGITEEYQAVRKSQGSNDERNSEKKEANF